MTQKSRLLIVLMAVTIVIALALVSLWVSGLTDRKGPDPTERFVVSSTSNRTSIHFSLTQFPPEIQSEVQTLIDRYSIEPNSLIFDPFNKEIDMIANGTSWQNLTRDLSGKSIGNFTIHIFNSTELNNKGAEVHEYLLQLRKNPDYQIGDVETVADLKGPYVILWCYNLTQENVKFENMAFRGWRIQVNVCCPVSHPIPTTRPERMNISEEYVPAIADESVNSLFT